VKEPETVLKLAKTENCAKVLFLSGLGTWIFGDIRGGIIHR
jgi:hypothetical protein